MNRTWRARVVVVSDQSLLTDVIIAALEENGVRCSRLSWPPGDGELPQVGAHPGGPALLISDLDQASCLRGAVRLILTVPARWVVLTEAPRGPLWGALLELGAVHVAAATSSLDEVVGILTATADGTFLTDEAERAALVASWQELRREYEEVVARLATMTPREMQVLRLLSSGSRARDIAHELGVPEATIRTLVKRVLHKLEVRSQLGAVAAFEQVRRAESAQSDLDSLAVAMGLARHAVTAAAP